MTEKVIKWGYSQNGKPNACKQRNMCKHKQHRHWQGDHYDIHSFYFISSLKHTETHAQWKNIGGHLDQSHLIFVSDLLPEN